MKPALVLWSVLAMAATALGQGQFYFNNRALPDVNAPILFDGAYLSGDYTVQLFGGPSGSPSSAWTELATTTFRTGNAAGYVNPITVTVPGATTLAAVEIRIFTGSTTSGRAPFATIYQVFNVPLAVPPNPPPTMPLVRAGSF
jgi:hypothetical protein